MTIRFGPAGIGSVKDAAENLEEYHKKGLRACEIPFTYGVFIKEDKHKKEIEDIKRASEKFDVKVSIHAPYWINLNSKEKQKIEESKNRILSCCKIGHKLGAEKIVFHPGYYGGMDEKETYETIKNAILDLEKEIKKKKWKVKLCPETTGKVNVFGKEEEILKLVKDTKCSFTIDFAHLLARTQGKMSYKGMYDKVKNFNEIHAHFSGIEWGEKGERRHIPTSDSEIKKLLKALPKNKNITIICEAPDPIKDSLKMLKLSRS